MNGSLLPLNIIREEFPATQNAIYMDVANQGLISRTTRTSFEEHLDNRLHGVNDELSQLRDIEKTRARFAQFIGADRDEISITKNASEGINIIANAIDWRPGDSVILCPQLEHANNILPWLQVKALHNVQLKFVEPEDGAIPLDAIVKALDSSTRVVALSTATMVPGFRTATEPIAEACRRHGTFLLADGTQSVGILHTEVDRLGVDGLAVSTVKGLMGLYGSGFLYCRRQWADRLRPAYLARFSVDLGNAPESAPILNAARLRAGAPRFDIGHYNFPGMIAAHASLGQLLEIGTDAIDNHVTSLAKRLVSGLLQVGMPVCGGAPGRHTGSIVALGDMATLSGAREVAPYIQSLQSYLAENKVFSSTRRGLLRFSLHLYNTEDEVDQVVDLVKNWSK
ncbi:MAG: aminotransferase class V-fold PLP-dependent enzyme [Mesorhizobium sp.]|uniref:aminotransferase class V-fold PLP-dependent enzyme n=1 Tax=Mesorhizobium sp. TaxID=1871066 RepID=UPI000FE64C1A|nr:aminotransferase class V-fold PLP-dependent enzyme [Mesorhizobium sp.]RWA75882.1 MAG: aminotransferase class V-fold PLP-dependent enzyme [Mesorhizobium sp.]TIS78472.1 MAG: aminotransferase class V-fold PLP-dependent enzyme [Mesorhizobium sp.]TIV73178.1 MAG: aminotransferase class V-fold PLP-dependent enzyme [Mesorhizobium sp.]